MISKVVFIGDPYRGEQAVNVDSVRTLFTPVLRQLGIADQCCVTEINKIVDREVWMPLWQGSLESYPECFCATVDLEDAAVIGFEVPEAELAYLDEQGVPWVNFSIHPLRFLDDLYFDVQTSFEFDARKCAASLGLIDFCVKKFHLSSRSKNNSPAHKTLLVCGQVWFDRSVYFDGQFRSLNHYINRLDELAPDYDVVLYKPHPFWASEAIAQLMADRYKARSCEVESIYDLLSSGDIHTIAAISSSILTEAPFFGIRAEFLEPRARRFGPAVSYRALIDDAEFWEKGLLGREKSMDALRISPGVPPNYLRKVFTSWGFVSDESRLEARITALGDDVSAAKAAVQDWSHRVSEVETQMLGYKERTIAAASEAKEHVQRAEAAEALTQEHAQRATDAEALAKQHAQRAEAAEALVREQRTATAEALAREYGQRANAAEALARQYEQRAAVAEALAREHEQRAVVAEAMVREYQRDAVTADSSAQENEQRVAAAEAVAQEQQKHIHEIESKSHYWQQRACELEIECSKLRQSASWRITAPLRGVGRGVVWLREPKINEPKASQDTFVFRILNAVHQFLIGILNRIVRYAQASPRFRHFVISVLSRMPGVAIKLRQIHLKAELRQIAASAEKELAGSGLPANGELWIGNQLIFKENSSRSEGINSSKRTPLEANFSAYRENK